MGRGSEGGNDTVNGMTKGKVCKGIGKDRQTGKIDIMDGVMDDGKGV